MIVQTDGRDCRRYGRDGQQEGRVSVLTLADEPVSVTVSMILSAREHVLHRFLGYEHRGEKQKDDLNKVGDCFPANGSVNKAGRQL